MLTNEISKIAEALRTAQERADKEDGAEVLAFLIQQAIDEAVAEAKRRGEPPPIPADSGIQ